jgi:hypothetical protein
MTNGPGKSDSPVVPEKSPNTAGQPDAEGKEGRGLAKGNLPQSKPRPGHRADKTRRVRWSGHVQWGQHLDAGNPLVRIRGGGREQS